MGGGNNSKNPFLPNFNMHLLPIIPLTRLLLKTPLVPEFGGLKILFPDLRRVVDLGRVVSDPDTKLDSEAGSDRQEQSEMSLSLYYGQFVIVFVCKTQLYKPLKEERREESKSVQSHYLHNIYI